MFHFSHFSLGGARKITQWSSLQSAAFSLCLTARLLMRMLLVSAPVARSSFAFALALASTFSAVSSTSMPTATGCTWWGSRVVRSNYAPSLLLQLFRHSPRLVHIRRRNVRQLWAPAPHVVTSSIVVFGLFGDIEFVHPAASHPRS
eukprot:SAG31_NODE_4406_length_3263_cov_1.473767_1_plen_145_part_10